MAPGYHPSSLRGGKTSWASADCRPARPPSLCHVTEFAAEIGQCHVEVAAHWSDRCIFVFIIPSFYLPLLFHTSGQANWRQLEPCPSPTLHQKSCWAFPPHWTVPGWRQDGARAQGRCLGMGLAIELPWPRAAISWRQVHVFLCLYRFGAPVLPQDQ